MTPQTAAMIRGAYGAIGTLLSSALVVYLSLLGQDGLSRADRIETALLTGGVAGLGYLGFRGGIEGRMDQARDDAGKVNDGDVGVPRNRPART